MDFKRIVLYVALFILGMMLWDRWQVAHPVVSNDASTLVSPAMTAPSLPNPVSSSSATPSNLPKQATSSHESLVTVKTDTLTVVIDTLGGRIVEASLPCYPAQLHAAEPVTLLNPSSDAYYQAQSGLTPLPGLTGQNVPYTSLKSSYQLNPGDQSLVVALTYHNPQGLVLTKLFTFKPQSYVVTVMDQVTNRGNTPWVGHDYMQTVRVNTPPASGHYMGFKGFFGAAISSPAQHYSQFSFSHLDNTPLQENITGGWLAFIQQYFLTAWVPDPSMNYSYFSQSDQNLYTLGMISPETTVAPGGSAIFQSKFYVGPQIASRLKTVAPYLNLTIDYGWLWPISVLLFWVLKHIEVILGNWGWSIVLLTVLIKLLFYKLSASSYRSMARMRLLQPKIQALKESLGDDKSAFGRATMELYRKEKVNPLGGCLPMLVQIPVFIALYYVLANSVELRQAPFILWIHDLATKDPYYILPVFMGLTMFIQQKLSPPPPDPVQAKLMLIGLPIFFTIFLANFPAGLVLYWTVNNGISILQQWYIMKQAEKSPVKKHHALTQHKHRRK